MARTIKQINDAMDAEQALQTGLSGLNSPSNSAIYTLFKYIVSVQMWIQEKLWDVFKSELETSITTAPVGNDSWLQKKIFEFQYSATTPQVTQLINNVPSYPIIDSTLRIVTRCSVKTTFLNTVDVKVAKSEPPVVLTSPELSSLQGYINSGGNGTISGAGYGIGFTGIRYVVNSFSSDKVFFEGEIIYDGQYAVVIQQTIVESLNNYLKNIPFDGKLKVVSFIDAMQQVNGVSDVIVKNLAIRLDSGLFSSKIYLVNNFTTIYSTYPIFAGYAVGETTVGETFNDKITYTVQ